MDCEQVSPYKEVGVVDMPLTKQVWKKIGQVVRANQQRHGGALK